ncbi:MAG: type II secretion system F family protein [Verrucomicrobia bacterium]|nr:type II secretion system F family protein [Verrucomicrobiota bacterium]
MPLIVTPSELERRAELYHQLGALLIAGVPVLQSLEHLGRNPPSRAFRKVLAQAHADISGGDNFTRSFSRADHDLPLFDVALLEAGEQSGRLEICLQMLAQYYRERAKLARQVISNCIYPAVLLHMVILIFPTSMLVALALRGETAPFVMQKVVMLAPIYAAIWIGAVLLQEKRSEQLRASLEHFLDAIPILGSARRKLALARLSAALEALIRAGVPVLAGWNLAAAASGSPRLRRRVAAWKPEFEMGQTPAELLRQSPEFPDMFANLYASGEISGQQDDTMHRLHMYYQEEGTRTMRTFAQWLPRLVYFVIVIVIAWQVISFYKGYFGQLGDVMQ